MPRRRNEPISAWEAGDVVEGFCLLSRKEQREDRNGRPFLDLEMTDATGTIAGKVWGDSPALKGEYEAYDYVAFLGTVKMYKDALQISLDTCRRVNDRDRDEGFDESRLVPSTREDIDDLWRRLESIYPGKVRRPSMRRLAEEALRRYGAELKIHPAAKVMHHAYRGGLLEHVVSMAELAMKVTRHYRDLDRDLLLLGVLFHDLGKIREIGAMPINDYTPEGRLVGHVVIGRDLVLECAASVPDFPADLRLQVEHLVLSHQGRKEYSAAVEPMTLEAIVLHFIDDLDAKINQIRGARERGSGIQYMRGLDRFFYLDGLTETPMPEEDDPWEEEAFEEQAYEAGGEPEGRQSAPAVAEATRFEAPLKAPRRPARRKVGKQSAAGEDAEDPPQSRLF